MKACEKLAVSPNTAEHLLTSVAKIENDAEECLSSVVLTILLTAG